MEVNNSKIKGVAFQGYQHKKTNMGAEAFHVNCMYDSSKYTCEFQCFKVGKDKNDNLYVKKGVDGRMEPFYTAEIPPSGLMVRPKRDLHLADDTPFAYRCVLKDKNDNSIAEYLREDCCDENGCTIVTRGITPIIQGPMYQAMVDTFNPGYVFAGFEDDNTGEIIEPTKDEKKEIADNIRNSVRTFSNTSGGTIAGLIVKLPELSENGIRRLSLTPIRGGDKTGHKYWINNDFIMAKGIGNINDYNTLIREAFKNDMNLVDDMAVTSEGLQGIHYQRAIKWMDNEEKPPEYYYFRMSGIKEGALGLGVVPKNLEVLNHKLVNFPFKFVEKEDKNGKITYTEVKNEQYDPKQPSYIQIFDNTMVSDEQRKDTTKVITSYDNVKTDNKLSANTHDDTVVPYTFEVSDPYEISKNVANLNEVNGVRSKNIKLNSPEGTLFISKLSGISIEGKNEGGFVCWDSNTDMPKRNYFTSNYDTELLSEIKDPIERSKEYARIARGNYEIQDVAISAAKHLVKHVKNVQTEYVAKTIGLISDDAESAVSDINNLFNAQDGKKPVLPEGARLDDEVITNVLSGYYRLKPKSDDYNKVLLSSIMDLPLDSLEFAPDTQGALSSPYLSKRSYDEDHLKESRYDAMYDKTYKVPKEYEQTYNKMNNLFKGEIRDFVADVLSSVEMNNSTEPMFAESDDNNKVLTEYGQYVIPMVAEDIAKYAIVKALMPEVRTKVLPNGEIAYDYDAMEKGSLRNLGINGDSQKNEANQIINAIHSGIKKLDERDIEFVSESISKRLENTNANSFKLAEVMLDRGGYGIDLRFDAAKDVVDMDAVRNRQQTFDKAWGNCKKFWGNIMDVVKDVNKNTTSYAEFTDISNNSYIDNFLNTTGIPSEANYSYFFDGITNLFGYDFTKPNGPKYDDKGKTARLEEVLYGFSQRPIEYKRNSYVFAGNHDKPRMVHCLSMDMELFQSNLSDTDNVSHKEKAYQIINDKMKLDDEDRKKLANSNYFDNVSSKAVANAWLLRCTIGKVNEELKQNELKGASNDAERNNINLKYNKIYESLSKSIADVVNGKYYRNHPEVLEKEGSSFKPYEHKSVPDDLKVVNEKDGFGTKAIPDAFDIIFDQACKKYGLNSNSEKPELTAKELLKYRNKVDSVATENGRAKTRIIMRYLGALTGNPTVYAGDELAMTGYEEKCKNVFLQNRNPLDWSVVDKNSENYRPDIVTYRDAIMGIMRQRKADTMNRTEALNNGTMYKLNKIGAINSDKEVSGIISQAGNGALAVSLFNPNGISQDPNTPESQLHAADLNIKEIPLYSSKGRISLTPGTEFKNILDRDDSVYRVYFDEKTNGYSIKKKINDHEGANIELNDNNAPDGVMMLYHLPKDVEEKRMNLIETRKRTLYNKVHNIPNPDTYKHIDA